MVEVGDEEIRVGCGEHERRLHLDHVVVRAVRAEQDAVIAHALNGGVGQVGGRCPFLSVTDELDAREETPATRVAHRPVTVTQVFEPLEQPPTHLGGVLP